MAGIMFQDVVSPRAHSNRKWYTVPLSFLVHIIVLAVLVVVPLIATNGMFPAPRTIMEFVTPYVPVLPTAPPLNRRVAPSAAAPYTGAAPVVAPDAIGAEHRRHLRAGRRRHHWYRKYRRWNRRRPDSRRSASTCCACTVEPSHCRGQHQAAFADEIRDAGLPRHRKVRESNRESSSSKR